MCQISRPRSSAKGTDPREHDRFGPRDRDPARELALRREEERDRILVQGEHRPSSSTGPSSSTVTDGRRLLFGGSFASPPFPAPMQYAAWRHHSARVSERRGLTACVKLLEAQPECRAATPRSRDELRALARAPQAHLPPSAQPQEMLQALCKIQDMTRPQRALQDLAPLLHCLV